MRDHVESRESFGYQKPERLFGWLGQMSATDKRFTVPDQLGDRISLPVELEDGDGLVLSAPAIQM